MRQTKGQLLDLAKHTKWASYRQGDKWRNLPFVATKSKQDEVQDFLVNTLSTSSFGVRNEQMFRVKAKGETAATAVLFHYTQTTFY